MICHSAGADYVCVDAESGKQMKVKVNEGKPTRLTDTELEVIQADGQVQYLTAQSQIDYGKIFWKKKFNIFPFKGDGLTISGSPGNCGNCDCDHDHFALILAELNLDGQMTSFTCHVTHL